MDNVDKCDQDEHDHHVEGSSTSCNDNFLTIAQVSNSTICGKKRVKNKQMSTFIDSLFTMHTSIECKIKIKLRSEEGLPIGLKL